MSTARFAALAALLFVALTAVMTYPQALRMVSDAGINIEYAYGGGSEGSPTATIVLGVDDAERASAAAGV